MVLPAEEFLPATLPMLAALRDEPAAQPWLAALPSLIEEVRAYFGLRLSPPLPGGTCSWVAPAELPDGMPAIVKIDWPHREMLGEPEALRLWDGRGASPGSSSRARTATRRAGCAPGAPCCASSGRYRRRRTGGSSHWRKSPSSGRSWRSGGWPRGAPATTPAWWRRGYACCACCPPPRSVRSCCTVTSTQPMSCRPAGPG